jgi:hypothetical protein
MQGGAALDTHGILPQFNKDKSHRHMFTMTGSGQFHSAGVRQGFAEHGRVHHTTMTAGGETAAAGELQVSQGRLEAISDASGHYRPGAAQTYQALKHMGSQGVDLSATNVELSGKGEGQRALNLSATEMMAYQPEMEKALRKAEKRRSERPLEGPYRESREDEFRDILNRPEALIREAHAKKDTVLQELQRRTAARRQQLDQAAAPATQGQRDLTQFEYDEAVRGTHQASSAMSRRMTPQQAEAARKELKAHWDAQQARHAGPPKEEAPAASASPATNAGTYFTAAPAEAADPGADTGVYLTEKLEEDTKKR